MLNTLSPVACLVCSDLWVWVSLGQRSEPAYIFRDTVSRDWPEGCGCPRVALLVQRYLSNQSLLFSNTILSKITL